MGYAFMGSIGMDRMPIESDQYRWYSGSIGCTKHKQDAPYIGCKSLYLRSERCSRALGREAETRKRGVKGRSARAGSWLVQIKLCCEIHRGLKGFFRAAASSVTWELTCRHGSCSWRGCYTCVCFSHDFSSILSV